MAPIAFVWYFTNKSEDSVASTITAVKKELLNGQRAQHRQDYLTAEKYYHRALEHVSNPVVADEQEVLEARAASLDMVCKLGRLN